MKRPTKTKWLILSKIVCTLFKWNIYGIVNIQETCNLHPSVAVLRLASNNGTDCSSTAWVCRNTHRSSLSRHAASLARAPGVPRPRTVNTAAMSVTRNSSVTCIRARGTTTTRISSDDHSLTLFSSTACLRTGTVWRPVVRATLRWTRSSASSVAYISASSSAAPPPRRKIHQGRQTDKDKENDQKTLSHTFKQQAKGERSKWSVNAVPGTFIPFP